MIARRKKTSGLIDDRLAILYGGELLCIRISDIEMCCANTQDRANLYISGWQPITCQFTVDTIWEAVKDKGDFMRSGQDFFNLRHLDKWNPRTRYIKTTNGWQLDLSEPDEAELERRFAMVLSNSRDYRDEFWARRAVKNDNCYSGEIIENHK